MKIERRCPFSGVNSTLEIDITEDQLSTYLDSDVPIQNMFPHLTPDEREFIKTGITASTWDQIFSEECEEFSSSVKVQDADIPDYMQEELNNR